MTRTLILGYGNPDREDDGVAYHLLLDIAKLLDEMGELYMVEGMDGFPEKPPMIEYAYYHLLFQLQLTPDLAEFISTFDRICFLDAHTGTVPTDLHTVELLPAFQNSPFTHHMTPQTVLALVDSLYHCNPEAVLISVRGYQFGFSRSLSPQTKQLTIEAMQMITKWLFKMQ